MEKINLSVTTNNITSERLRIIKFDSFKTRLPKVKLMILIILNTTS